ncbi:hypothetical protein MRX96_057904 [Rhipicephalus microplus]
MLPSRPVLPTERAAVPSSPLDAKKPLPGVAHAHSAYSVNDRRAAAVSTSHPGPSGRFTGAYFGGMMRSEEEKERRRQKRNTSAMGVEIEIIPRRPQGP